MILEYKKLVTIYASGACCSILYILYFSSISIFLFLSKRFACLVLMQRHKNFIILVHNAVYSLVHFNTDGSGFLTVFFL